MKKLVYLLPVTLLCFSACDDKTESKRQGTDAAVEVFGQASTAMAATTDARNTQETERQDTQRQVEERFNELSNRIKDLKAQMAKATEKAKAELNEMIKELDKKMAAAKQQLERLKSASAKAWEEAKSKTTAALDDLQKAYGGGASKEIGLIPLIAVKSKRCSHSSTEPSNSISLRS